VNTTQTTTKGAMSVATFGERFDLCKASVHKLIREGKLHTVKVGRRRLIPVEAAEAWWASCQKAG
jgi:excisionase family DNA binding protein